MFRAGFIGVGFMGRGMLRNIVKKTNAEIVSIYDVNSDNINEFMNSLTSAETMKVRICRCPADVAKRSDIISLSLPSEKITSNVLFGDEGLLEGFLATGENLSEDISKCPIIIDHGTFSRTFVIENNSSASMMGISYIDAPVSGGPTGAENGTLTVMMGGEEVTVNRAKPLIQCFSSNIVHFGAIGSGSAAKLVNQALVGMHTQASVEALCLAEKMGLTSNTEGTQKLLEMLRTSWGQSKILDLTFQDYIKMQHDPLGFESDFIRKSPAPLRNLKKDFSCIMEEIPENGNLKLPILKYTGDAIDSACSESKGLSNSAFLSLIELLRNNKK